jgi:predicted phosphodiesterase
VRYLILSDLHANLEALNAALRQSAGAWDSAICCGDLVGYGADPNAVVEWVRDNCPVVVRGNHDRASTGMEDLEWFNPVARAAAVWTLSALTPENADYIRALPRGPLSVEDFQVVHGSPFDEDEYVIAPNEATTAFGYLERRLAFFGHTHVQGGFIWNQSRVETIMRPTPGNGSEFLDIDPSCAYLINPGSVGQPRDGDARASYVLYDSETRRVEYCRAAYDVVTAQKKIYDSGLPPILGDRLVVGR